VLESYLFNIMHLDIVYINTFKKYLNFKMHIEFSQSSNFAAFYSKKFVILTLNLYWTLYFFDFMFSLRVTRRAGLRYRTARQLPGAPTYKTL